MYGNLPSTSKTTENARCKIASKTESEVTLQMAGKMYIFKRPAIWRIMICKGDIKI